MTGHLELWVLGLLAAVAGLVMLSNQLGVPYPVFLVLGGLALGLIPIVPEIGLPPDLVLLIFRRSCTRRPFSPPHATSRQT